MQYPMRAVNYTDRSMDKLSAENHDPVFHNRLRNRASYVQDNFNGGLYNNQ
jgi:hypothetical protein|tara:strand:+ start:289 stop:441 length:153 start_codon:yes stop_codon:yes gene_type:complete